MDLFLKDMNPFWDELNDEDYIRKNPDMISKKWNSLSPQDKDRYYNANTPAGQALRNHLQSTVGAGTARSQLIGGEIADRDAQRRQRQQTQTQVNQSQDFLTGLRDTLNENATRNQNELTQREQQLRNDHKAFLEGLLRNDLSPQERLRLGKEYALFAANTKFSFLEKENKLKDEDFKMETQANRENALLDANIKQAANRENNLYNLSASNLSNQLTAYANSNIRSNEVIQTLSNAGKPNYGWIR